MADKKPYRQPRSPDGKRLNKYVAENFEVFARRRLHISPKAGAIIAFQLNKAQLRMEEKIREIQAAGKPVRLIVCKARQLGISTWSLGRMYHYAISHPGVQCLMAAHDDEATTDLFDRVQTMHTLDPKGPPTRFSNARVLDFSNPDRKKRRQSPGLLSRITVATARRKTLGRSRTLRYVHLSEAALFEHATDVLLSVENCVPRDPNTFIIIESTARGTGGEFYTRWQTVNEPGYRGDWVPIFFPWYDAEDYQIPVDGEMLPIPKGIVDHETFLREEKSITESYGLTPAQLNWRRYMIGEKCQNDMRKLRQEYPIDPEECFVSSGRCVFNVDRLRVRERWLRMQDAQLGAKGTPRGWRGDIIRSAGKGKLIPKADDGPLVVYKWNEPGRQYIIGCDPCKGVVKGRDPDNACIQIIDSLTCEQVATWCGRVDATELAWKAEHLGYQYNQALIVPESNDHGHTVCQRLLDRGYPNLYIRQDMDALGTSPIDRPGWETNSKTRDLMIDAVIEGIAENNLILNDIETIREMLTFVHNEKTGKAAADMGAHDDRVIGIALALAVRYQRLRDPGQVSELSSRPAHPDVAMVQRDRERLLQAYNAPGQNSFWPQ